MNKYLGTENDLAAEGYAKHILTIFSLSARKEYLPIWVHKSVCRAHTTLAIDLSRYFGEWRGRGVPTTGERSPRSTLRRFLRALTARKSNERLWSRQPPGSPTSLRKRNGPPNSGRNTTSWLGSPARCLQRELSNCPLGPDEPRCSCRRHQVRKARDRRSWWLGVQLLAPESGWLLFHQHKLKSSSPC